MSGRKMCCGMRAARRRFSYLFPTLTSQHLLLPFLLPSPFPLAPLPPIPSLRLLSPTRCSAVSFAKKIVFISTVVRMDSVPVIYVSAQTHLIYSAKHNSLTLFWGKALIYLGYATKSRELQRLAHSYQQFRLLLYLSPIFYIRRSSLDLLGSRFDLGFTLYRFGTTVSLFLSG